VAKIHGQFLSTFLNYPSRIWIYLPKDYETSHKKYEVMYLQDAQNLFDDATSYAGEWQVDETLNKIFEKTGKSLIVVGIDNGGEKRIEELSPYKNAKYGGGNGDNYVKFIVETLNLSLIKTTEQNLNENLPQLVEVLSEV
jgi:predicted alpha/beta superfamily hydrolase